MLRIEMLPAYEGNALWVEYGNPLAPRRLVIDAGRKETYRALVDRLTVLNDPVELFVLTHIDDDHIYEAIPLFADGRINRDTFKDIWYNGYTHLDPAIARRPPADLLGAGEGRNLRCPAPATQSPLERSLRSQRHRRCARQGYLPASPWTRREPSPERCSPWAAAWRRPSRCPTTTPP